MKADFADFYIRHFTIKYFNLLECETWYTSSMRFKLSAYEVLKINSQKCHVTNDTLLYQFLMSLYTLIMRWKYIRLRVHNFYSKIFSGKYSQNYHLKTLDSCNREFLSLELERQIITRINTIIYNNMFVYNHTLDMHWWVWIEVIECI